MSEALRALAALTDQLDALQARVKAAYPREVECRAGCSSCCHQEVALSAVEAARLAEAVAALDEAARARLAATVARGRVEVCGALDDDGACQVYAGRPVVCRSHGLIYTYRPPRGGAPDHARSCGLNFRGDAPVPLLRLRSPRRSDPSLTHDSDRNAERLAAIDRAYAAETGVAGAPTTINAVLRRLVAP